MGRHAYLARWLTAAKLRERYRKSRTLPEARRWQLLWFLADGMPLKVAASLVGFSERHAQRVLQRYNERGPTAWRRKTSHHDPPRRAPLLSPTQQQELARLLRGKAPDGGVWTGPKVARWISEQLGGVPVHPQRGWDYLQRLTFSWQVPRPRHKDADPEAQRFFKKT